MSAARDQLGGGIAFPFRIGPDGRVATSGGARNVRELIEVVLRTRHGERVRLPGLRRRTRRAAVRAEQPGDAPRDRGADQRASSRPGSRERSSSRSRSSPTRATPRRPSPPCATGSPPPVRRRRSRSRCRSEADRHGHHATPARPARPRRARRRGAAARPGLHARVDELPPRRRRRHPRRALLVPRRVRDLPGEPRAGAQPARVRRAARRAARAGAARAGHRLADPAAVRRAGAGDDGARGVRRLGAVPAHERARRAARRGARRRARGAARAARPSSSPATKRMYQLAGRGDRSTRSRRSTARCRSAPKGGRRRSPTPSTAACGSRCSCPSRSPRRRARPRSGARSPGGPCRSASSPRRRARPSPTRPPPRAPPPAPRRRSPSSCRAPARSSCATSRAHVEWATVPAIAEHDLLADPGILHVTLPGLAGLQAVHGAEPLEAGVGELPPDLQDPELEARVVTWLRLRAPASSSARMVWVGVNAATVSQRGPRDRRARRLRQRAARPGGAAGPHAGGQRQRAPARRRARRRARVARDRRPARRGRRGRARAAHRPARLGGAASPSCRGRTACSRCRAADGALRFGDGRHGRRPPAQAAMTADYDHALGAAGNVPPGAITSSPALPAGVKVTNPVRTWGGADAESVADAERHAARFVQHRDRLVTPQDIEAIALRTPGVDVGRVEVDQLLRPAARRDAARRRRRLRDRAGDPTPRPGAARDAGARPGVPRHRLPPSRAAAARHDRAVRARAERTSTCG